MDNIETRQPGGSLRISQDVIATIAGSVVTEIPGVASLASGNVNLKGLLKKQSFKPITIEISDDVATIEVHVNLKSGAKIPEVASAMQQAIKEAVQNMTGIAVARVNVTIAGIVFDQAQPEL